MLSMNNSTHKNRNVGISSCIIAFAQYARTKGLNVGLQETQDALRAADCGILEDKVTFEFGLKALFCCSEEDRSLFDQLFEIYWLGKSEKIGQVEKKTPSKFLRSQEGSVVMMGKGEVGQEEEEGKNVSGANAVERLRQTDFSKVSEIESELLEAVAERLWKEMGLRLKRRLKTSYGKGQIDLRKTIRNNIGRGGEPLDLIFKNKKNRKQRLVVLLDVSGSMDKYSFFLLRFVCALKEHFRQLEAFIFSTELRRITDLLQAKGLAATLRLLAQKADNWSSGTKIGECLKAFNACYAKRVLGGNSLTIILSDGLDTGNVEMLETELKKIKKRTKKLLWLNPLKGMKGYEPTARGMSAALPVVDVFESAHNLNSLLELEKFLSHV